MSILLLMALKSCTLVFINCNEVGGGQLDLQSAITHKSQYHKQAAFWKKNTFSHQVNGIYCLKCVIFLCCRISTITILCPFLYQGLKEDERHVLHVCREEDTHVQHVHDVA